jgi:hypothetical protein
MPRRVWPTCRAAGRPGLAEAEHTEEDRALRREPVGGRLPSLPAMTDRSNVGQLIESNNREDLKAGPGGRRQVPYRARCAGPR